VGERDGTAAVLTLPLAETADWKQINFRRTRTLLAAEFLHELYARHNPFVNPLHLGTVAVRFRPWTATSYAPRREFDAMNAWLQARFVADPTRRCRELRQVMSRPRSRTKEFTARLECLSVEGLSDVDVLDLLVDTQFIPLGDIYEINLVQLERALHLALRDRLVRLAPQAGSSVIDTIVATVCQSRVPTALVSDDLEFSRFVLDTLHEPAHVVDEELRQRAEAFEALTTGYGAHTDATSVLRRRYDALAGMGREQLRHRVANGHRPPAPRGGDLPLGVARDVVVVELAETLRLMGDVRDANKRLLGGVIRHRARLVDEIERRCQLPRGETALYLLAELCSLVIEGTPVALSTISARRHDGVVLWRECHAREPAVREPFEPYPASPQGPSRLKGVSACGGVFHGPAFVVGQGPDEDMRPGDVLVAAGTDFDLALNLTLAGAVVTEEDGILSHAAVVARERGIPCVIGVTGATSRLQTGTVVTVNGDSGTVEATGGGTQR
jgi:phosphohistidine swiveling domain-containing protein